MSENENLYSLENGGVWMLAVCRACNKRRALDPKLMERYSNVGSMIAVASLAQRMRCEACGEKAITAYGQPRGFPLEVFLEAGPGELCERDEAANYARMLRSNGARE